MKKLWTVLTMLMLLACSDDDGGEGTNPNEGLAAGTWNLTELRISPAQDIDEDGASTTNILEELPCITGQIILRDDNTWSFSGNDVVITTITGGLFKFFCGEDIQTDGGNWDVQGNTIRLVNTSGTLTQFSLDPDALTLTNIIGEDLPGLQAEVYTRQ